MDPIFGGLIAGVGSLLGNVFGANSAQKQMDFQADQYGKRYQTQMADMQKAGLNPMLSYMQSPGSAPSGTSFTPSNIGAAAVEGYNSTSNSATTNAMRNVQVANMVADTKLKESSSSSALASAEASLANAKLSNVNSAVTAASLPFASDKAAQSALGVSADTAGKEFGLPEKRNSAEFYNSAAGKLAQRIGMFINSVTGGGNSATALSTAKGMIGR